MCTLLLHVVQTLPWLTYFVSYHPLQDVKALFSETSALSGDNVLQSHTTLASLLLEREDQDMEVIRQSAVKLSKEHKKCRC